MCAAVARSSQFHHQTFAEEPRGPKGHLKERVGLVSFLHLLFAVAWSITKLQLLSQPTPSTPGPHRPPRFLRASSAVGREKLGRCAELGGTDPLALQWGLYLTLFSHLSLLGSWMMSSHVLGFPEF